MMTQRSLSGSRVLIVADEDSISLRTSLEAAGFDVVISSQSRSVATCPGGVDLLIIGPHLPNEDALDLCRHFRTAPATIGVPIIFTKMPGQHQIGDLLTAYVDDCIVAPIDHDQLITRAQTLIRSRQVETELRERIRELEAIRRLTSTLINTVAVADLAQNVVDAIPAAFGLASGFLGGVLTTIDHQTGLIRAHAVTDIPLAHQAIRLIGRPFHDIVDHFDPPHNLTQRAAVETRIHESASLVELISPTMPVAVAWAIEHLLGMRGGIAVPVVVQRRTVGVLLLILTKPTAAVTLIEREVIGDFADAVGIALENVRLYGEASQLTLTDELTGIANRRRFDQAIAEEATRAERLGYPLGLILIDIDHFKEYNDRHGHPRGDQVLRRVAQELRRQVRQTDLVARYGGEEFAVILPGVERTGLATTAEKLRVAVENLVADDHPLGLSISLGGATTPPLPAEPVALIDTADGALYSAKRLGRNQVVVPV